MRALALLGLLFILLSPLAARAVEPDEILANPVLEARARAISAGLRCMVCQNESIDDSDADLAKDLRILIRQKLKAGASDDQIRAYLVQRYGDFILLKPPFEGATLLLWLGPALVLVLGAGASLRSRPAQSRGRGRGTGGTFRRGKTAARRHPRPQRDVAETAARPVIKKVSSRGHRRVSRHSPF